MILALLAHHAGLRIELVSVLLTDVSLDLGVLLPHHGGLGRGDDEFDQSN